MTHEEARQLVIIAVALLAYHIVLGPIVMAIVRDWLRGRRERNAPPSGKRGKKEE